ncbi:MAG: carbon-nitrogen hydrolase family protein [Chloroflexi bacterium]|nr:carbon-nitrogen hydrolase family protein [Chloroflexota bacterium]MCI0577691.1 carbon-nitrogen hydrolase family protein [Chloroflexota bacterium]MCI0644589.1 carbon-nitrogen hydrolase family protein [Chloroflexota bacterium]MCI0728239.1 carbon-nitrogen hydrolase family protein [Chloroflexota bacterium]
MTETPFLVAAAQASPVFLNRAATVDKACALIAEAGRAGARLLVFPEAFIPAYPDWVWAVPAGEQQLLSELYAELVANAVTIPSEVTGQLGQAARAAGVTVVIGLSERNVEASGVTLYNTLLTIDAQGRLLGKHRKLVPTGGERLVWAQGDGSTLQVYDTPIGKVGGLICWENYMPLARYALYAWGTQIYVAATWDRGEPWLSTLRHIAAEGRVYVIGCGMALRQADIPDHYEFKQRFYQQVGEWVNGGDSAIVSPNGHFIAGPLHQEEGILYAEVNPAEMCGSKWMLDVAGHYARPDVFQLSVNRQPRPLIQDEPERGEQPEQL